MPVSIMLDAGHGGRDPGAVYNGRQEKDDVLKLALGEDLFWSGAAIGGGRVCPSVERPLIRMSE